MREARKSRAGAHWLLAPVVLAALCCGRSADGDRDRVELVSSWLGSCTSDAECAEGSCLCGVCTLACEDDASCAAEGPPNARCVEPELWANAALCAGRASSGLCLSGCAGPADCDTDLECIGGLCLPDAAAAIARVAELGPAGGWCEREGVLFRSLKIEQQAQIDAVRGCERIAGDVTIEPFEGADFSPFEALLQIDGALEIGTPPDEPDPSAAPGEVDVERVPVSLRGFERVERVGALRLGGLVLERLAFDALEVIEPAASSDFPTSEVYTGDPTNLPSDPVLAIVGCAGFRTLEGLGSLERVETMSVGTNADLESLVGLNPAAQIERLIMSGNPALESLVGFPALADLEELRIDTSRALDDLTALSGLSSVGSLAIAGTSLRDLSGLGGLTAIDSLALSENSELSSLAGLGDTRGLGRLYLTGNRVLSSLDGLEAPRTMIELNIGTSPQLTSLVQLGGVEYIDQLGLMDVALTSFAGLESLADARLVYIAGTNVESFTGLGALRSLEVLDLYGNTRLTDLAGMTVLERVDLLNTAENALTRLSLGAARITGLALRDEPLVNLGGLERASVAESLTLVSMPVLASLDGLGAIEPGASVRISAPALANVDALGGVTDLSSLEIFGTAIANLDPLSSLRRLAALTLDNNPNLVQVDALGQVDGLAGLQVTGNPSLVSLPAFAAARVPGPACLDSCVLRLYVSDNVSLETGPSLPLVELGEFVRVDANPRLTSLGFAGLRSVGDLQIVGNPLLTELDVGSLESVERAVVRGTALPEVALAPVRAAIVPGNEARSKIVSNGEGPSRLDPCPWVEDSVCDEVFEECASGTDASDCASYYEELAAAGIEGEVP